MQKTKPNKNHKIKIINYKPYTEKQGTDFEAYINSTNKTVKKIEQNELIENIANWNFIKWDKILIDLYDSYKKNSNSIEEYRARDLNNYDEIQFDGNINIDNKKIKDKNSKPKLGKTSFSLVK